MSGAAAHAGSSLVRSSASTGCMSAPLTAATRVYYASYGSNMLHRRLMAYIAGGVMDGVSHVHAGCSDPTPPRGWRLVSSPLRLRFAHHSGRWGGGVAFLQLPSPGVEPWFKSCDASGDWDGASTLLRLYDVSLDQFIGVARQEMGGAGGEVLTPSAVTDLICGGPGSRLQVAACWYGCTLYLGALDGTPVFTFTSCDEEGTHVAPSDLYASVIAQGLCEAGLPASRAQQYVAQWGPGDGEE